MQYTIKNIKLSDVTEDSGWVVFQKGNCYTQWKRVIVTQRSPDEIYNELRNASDYPGWTGVNYAPGYSKPGILVFTSTYDSGD
jgi:hypothetical protein